MEVWAVYNGYLVKASADKLVCGSLESSKVYESGELQDSVLNSFKSKVVVDVKFNVSSGTLETFILRESRGLELKPIEITLVKSELKLNELIIDLVNDRNSAHAQLIETVEIESKSERAMQLMVDEKIDIQNNALKCISSILEERNKLIQ